MDGDSVSPTSTTAPVSPFGQTFSARNETSATKVFVRVRPFNAAERGKAGGEPMAIVTVSDENPSHITTLDPSKGYQPKTTYVFDRCFNSAAAGVSDEAQRLLLGDAKDNGSQPTALTALEEGVVEVARNPILLDCLRRDQAAVYGQVGRPVLLNALAGYNGCVFAYGQTGSGKTYTMMGPPGTFGSTVMGAHAQLKSVTATATPTPVKKFRRAATAYNGPLRWTPDVSAEEAAELHTESFASMIPSTGGQRDTMSLAGDRSSPRDCSLSALSDAAATRSRRSRHQDSKSLYTGEEVGLQGIVPRLVRELFAELHQKREQDSSHSFRVEVEYYEIYREKVMDLLSSGGGNVELRVRHSKSAGPYVENLTRKHVVDEGEVLRLLRHGNLRRHTASTVMNDRSSRSHAIFVLHLVQMRISDTDSTSAKVSSKVNLVDLAGSERTGAHHVEGDQFKEGVVINSSLTVLGRVIDALADKSSGKRHVFCPYRDSVLTWLLMDSLGGNSKTTMVATVSPHPSNFDEACQTLRYASRAKQIVTKVVVNEDPQVRQIKLLTAEVQRLKALLSAEGKAVGNGDDDVDALQERIWALEEELNETRSELEQKSSELAAIYASRCTSSTLKPANAGAAGTAKELAKAKAEVRRLEAENLLHLQTEQELQSTMERLKTLEKKYGQLLSDGKEAQEAARKREKEMQDKDKRISELQHQLEQEVVRMRADSPRMHSPCIMSPRPPSGQCAKGAGKKKKKAKAGAASDVSTPTAAAAPAYPQQSDSETLMEKAQLKAQFEEERKRLALQLQERNDAFRKSQLEVKRLKSELKGEQDALQLLEKHLHDQHAEATRRLQEEVQELKRALKGERRQSKDLRQLLTGPIEERPVFSYAYVSQTVVDEEQKWRGHLLQQEATTRQHVQQVWQLSRDEMVKAAAVERQQMASLAKWQCTAEEQRTRLEEAQAAHAAMEEEHAALLEALKRSQGTLEAMRQELEEMRAAREEASHLRQQLLDLQGWLSQEQVRSAAVSQRLEAELQDQMQAAAAAEEATASLKAAHDEEVLRAEAAMKAEKEAHAVTVASLQAQLRQAEDKLRRSEDARRVQVRRGLEQASEHETALAALQSQLQASEKAATAAAEAHAGERAALQQKLTHQEEAHADRRAALERGLEAARTQLGRDREASAKAASKVEEQLTAAQAEHTAFVEVLQSNVERALTQTDAKLQRGIPSIEARAETADAERLTQVAERLECQRAQQGTATAPLAGVAATRQSERAKARNASADHERAFASVLDRATALRAALAQSREAQEAHMQRLADELAAQDGVIQAVKQDLQRQRAEAADAAAAHETQLREIEAKCRQQVASKETAIESIRLEAAAQRRAEVNAATEAHTAVVSALNATLSEVRSRLSEAEASLAAEAKQREEQASDHAKALSTLRAELRCAHETSAEAAAAHEAAVQQLEGVIAEERRAKAEEVAAIAQQLRETQRHLITSEEARRREAAENAVLAATQAKSLDALRHSMEAEYEQKLAALTEAKAAEMEVVQMQLDAQRAVVQQLQADLRGAHGQVRQMTKTQNDMSKQMAAEKETSAELRSRLEDTAAQLAASTATMAELETTLQETKASLAQLVAEKTAVLAELAQAIESEEVTRARLADVEKISQQRGAELEAQGAALAEMGATVEQLRAEVSALQLQCAEKERAHAALIEQHREALVAQQVDTVTELEAQFRSMEHEREMIVLQARQREDALRSVIEKQEKSLQQLREDLDFRTSLDLCEAEVVERDSAIAAAAHATGLGVAVSGAGVSSSANTSFSGPGGSSSAVGGGFSTILTSFFSRRNSAAASPPSNALSGGGSGADGAHGLPQTQPHPFPSNDESSATAPLRGNSSGNLHTFSPFRPSSMSSSGLFIKKNSTMAAMGSNTGVPSALRRPVPDGVEGCDANEHEAVAHTRLGNRAPNIALGRK
ncbi:hypothetical protein LSCM1_06260 [Leishmania martiniquensis]|uniref:Kinesin motor domain-containing protein n=1 Tax=Leishmania martiniquensis TaxID=1580590 RepID=A0A836GSJ7_9TRYP|nr:hypothetical protein LSCM1_06260 [Leishmania martiniquensis]